MRPWHEVKLQFETSDGRTFQVEGETFHSGSHDEPMLELDGEVMLRSLASDSWLSPEEARLSESDLKRLEQDVEDELIRLQDAYSCDISQSILESAADALYDAWKDRD